MTVAALPRGPLMLGIDGLELGAVDRERLLHPTVGGVILFARNYASPAQLIALCGQVADLRLPRLLIAVDHEGGRVQRFREGFTRIPAMRALGELAELVPDAARHEALRLGWTIASELRGCGIDFSFAPVLDLDHGASTVIGDRSFHRDPRVAATLAGALRDGLRAGGVAAVGKHFPGHGAVAADSHAALPVDPRPLAEIVEQDLLPFAVLSRAGLEGVMPAHVVYPDVDRLPAGYSRRWLVDILRGWLAFDGLVFSDDLGMEGAAGAGDIVDRAEAAARAGCDIVLSCNDAGAADALLSRWVPPPSPELARRTAAMEGTYPGPCPVGPAPAWDALLARVADRAPSPAGGADAVGELARRPGGSGDA